MLTIRAPAKINLTLEVVAKRQDGFHEIHSIIQTINLCDTLCFQPSQNIEFKCNAPDWIPEGSLVSKTVSRLQEATGCTKGVRIEVSKHIPLVSGLGGDSSNAATTLCGLNKLWELGLSPEKLVELATGLGSDVAFFFYGSTALVKGRGEIVTSLPPLPHMWAVLMIPPVPKPPRKTEQLYTSLKASHYTDGQITQRLANRLTGGGEITPSMLFNTFDNVAIDSFSELGKYREHFLHAGTTDVHLAGTGPALFTLVKNRNQAEEIYNRLQQQKLESYLVDTLAVIEQIA